MTDTSGITIATRLALVFAMPILLTSPVSAQQPEYWTASQATADPAVAVLAGGSLLALPGIRTDFVLSGGGQLTQLPNGNAQLTARVESASALDEVFLLNLNLGGRINPGSPSHPPQGSPVLALQPSAYVPSGPVDPTTFRYYTTATGTLIGVDKFANARLTLQLNGTAIQIGEGANNRRGSMGLAGEFVAQIQQQPLYPLTLTGNATLQADLEPDRRFAATHVLVDPALTTLPTAGAFELPGVANDYVFAPIGSFSELPDGTAQVNGTLLRIGQSNDRWTLSLALSQRIDPGETGFPPAGSPILGLQSHAYTAQGGPVDPAAWHYYRQATGTLAGDGINAGGLVTLAGNPASGALQVGAGANLATLFWGVHGQLQVQVLSQPTGRTIALTGNASLHANVAAHAVLPQPTLATGGPNPTLETVTELGVVLNGDNLLWIEQVAIAANIVVSQDPATWSTGYYRILDNQNIEVHPRQAMVPGTYPIAVLNNATSSNALQLDLTAPTSPRLRSEVVVRGGGPQHVFVHHGGMIGPVLTAVGTSFSLLPSVIPGVAQIGIGNQFQQLLVAYNSLPHDPITGVGSFVVPSTNALIGGTLHYQAVLLDFANPVLPLPATNIWSTSFTQ